MPDRNISLKLNTKLNLFPQEQQQDRLCLHLWNKQKKKLVCLEFSEAFSWLHIYLLLVQMHCYTTSVS